MNDDVPENGGLEDRADMERDDIRRDPKAAAERVRALLDGRSRPFWTTTTGPEIRPFIKIECEDLELAHALDDFLIACVRSHGL